MNNDVEGYVLVLVAMVLLVVALILGFTRGRGDGRCDQACWSMGEHANSSDGCWCSKSGKIELATSPE